MIAGRHTISSTSDEKKYGLRYGPFCVIITLILSLSSAASASQSDSLTRVQKRNRQIGVITGFAAGYTTSLILLHNAWYQQDEPRSVFYFHNDLPQWKQVDKAGHFWTQYHLWNEVRIMPKFSFHKTSIETARIMDVGDHYFEQTLKDYNGQTYWLAADLSAFLPRENRFPKWLNIAVGYGASEMAAGSPAENRRLGYDSYRQYYLTLDLNLMNIKTRSKVLKTVFNVVSAFHLPAPALEYNRKQGFVFRPLFY